MYVPFVDVVVVVVVVVKGDQKWFEIVESRKDFKSPLKKNAEKCNSEFSHLFGAQKDRKSHLENYVERKIIEHFFPLF